MIKRKITIFAILLFAFSLSNTSCKKDIEDTIECIAEGLLVNINHTVDSQDPNTISFKITYSGDHKLDNSIKWDFGDGQVETLNGAIVEHTYSSAGTYHAKAEVTIRNGDAWCTFDLEETVTIN